MLVNAIIPAKGHSTRVRNKNLYKINGKSLIYRTCEKLLQSKIIDKIYLDTEDLEIIADVKTLLQNGLQLIKRPPQLANNSISANDLLIYQLHSIEDCDLLVQTFCTSPLIKINTIDGCIKKFLDKASEEKYDSFFTVTKIQEYFWNDKNPINFDLKKLPNSFELEPWAMETHGLYGIFTNDLIKYKTRIGKKPLQLEISKLEALDINDYEDLEILEKMLNE